MKKTSLKIIIAEDDIDDRLLMNSAFSEMGISFVESDLTFVENGYELIEGLKNGILKPSLIFLDLNMPKMDGRETLKLLKSNELYKHIPIIIFSTSNLEEDILSSYKQGSNAYFVKPALFSELVETLETIVAHWMRKAALPESV